MTDGNDNPDFVRVFNNGNIHIAQVKSINLSDGSEKTLCGQMKVPRTASNKFHRPGRVNRKRTKPFNGLGVHGHDVTDFCKVCLDTYKQIQYENGD